MHNFDITRLKSTLTLAAAAAVLAGCFDSGEGPQRIENSPATPLPELPAGFCDAINFELLCGDNAEIINFNGGATTIIDNPDPSGINTSDTVAQMQKFPDQVFGGTRLNYPSLIDFAEGFAWKVKVWSPRPVPFTFKVEETGSTFGPEAVGTHTGSSSWEEFCFDFTGLTNNLVVYNGVTLIFENGTLGAADTDPDNWTFFYDDIEQVDSCSTAAANNLATNGDFESGDLTGWNATGSILADISDSNGGDWSVNIVSAQAQTSVLAQAGIGAGEVSPGDEVNVSFDMKGTAANGGVVNVELFTLGDVGVTGNELLATIPDPTADWTTYQYTASIPAAAGTGGSPALSGDVSQGLTIQFAVACGDVENCLANVNIDNVVVESGPPQADTGIIPQNVVYATDPAINEDIAAPGNDNFGSGATFDFNYAGDTSFNPVIRVSSGTGYGADAGFIAFTGYAAGFAQSYDSFVFKVKGDAENLDEFEVKFIGGTDTSLVLDLTTYAGATDLGDGWIQVNVPMSSFAANIAVNDGFLLGPLGAQPAAFSFLLTDIGFIATADTGIVPEGVVYATDPAVTRDLARGVDNFGSGATFDFEFAGDLSFNPVIQSVSGTGYGAGVHVGFVAFTGYDAGFASGFDNFVFKVKGDAENLDEFEVKFIGGVDAANEISQTYNVLSIGTDLGDGWYQVSVPMSDFAANIAVNTGFLLGPLGAQPAPFSYLMTDIGFTTDSGGGSGGGGSGGDASNFAVNGDLETGDLTGWTTFDNGGTIAVVDTDAASGTYSIKLISQWDGTTAANPVIKQEQVGQGEVTTSQDLTISFDIKGTIGVAGAATAQFFSEGAGGVSGDAVLETFTTDIADWTSRSYTVTTSADVTNGVTFQLTAACGAVDGCAIDLSLDNLVIAPADAGAGSGGGSTPVADIDFEGGSYTFNDFNGGVAAVVANPDATGLNTSVQVAQMQKFPGAVFGGSTLDLGGSVALAAGDSYTMLVRATREVPVTLKLEPLEQERVATHSGSGAWEELCFDFTGVSGDVTGYTVIFDNGVAGAADTDPDNWTFQFDDIQQVAGGCSTGASAGITPENVVYATDPAVTEDLAPAGTDNFGSGAVFDFEFGGDSSFDPVIQTVSGEGYGAGVHVGFVAFTGYTAGFASGFDNFVFKVKGDAANLDEFEVKFIGGTDTSQTYDITTYAGSTDLGDGWYQVSIPMSDFAANIAVNDGFLLGPLGGQPAPFSFLMTDIGFVADAGAGITPDNVVYATDPAVTEDLAPAGTDNFGSGAVFDFNFAGDADYNPAIQATSGEGYGGGVHVAFVAFTGYSAGFAGGYENFVFKVKGDAANLDEFEVKFIGGTDTSQTYDITSYSGSTDLGNGWYQVSIPLTDFAATIDVNDGFLLGPLGAQPAPFSFLLTDIGFTGTGSPGSGGGSGGGDPGDNLAVNGDLETGDTSGWTTFDNGGTVSLNTTDSAGGGSFSLNFSTSSDGSAGSNPVVKQEQVGQGVVTGGQNLTISFDLKGTVTQPGAAVVAEFFSEGTVVTPVTLNTFADSIADWTTYTYNVTTAADVSNGVTLQLVGACGAVDGCAIDMNIDNVSITID